MTDNSTLLNTHTAPFLDAITGSIHRSTPDADTSPSLQNPPEEEPYTIKCICDFAEDDGLTVYCEKCETWQHIDCYYHSPKAVPEVHKCTDCQPRPVDSRTANERQRRRRDKMDVGDRKSRRPPGKSHKKKVKVPVQGAPHLNGWAPSEKHETPSVNGRRSGSPKDQPPPAKKSKTVHRASSSVSSHAGTTAVAIDRRKRAGSNPHHAHSPVKSSATQSPPNGSRTEQYSPEFLQLYEDDPGDIAMQANLFNSIDITNSLSTWSNDRDALAQATGGRTPQEVFQRVDGPFESVGSVGIQKQTREDRSVLFSGKHPVWHYLTVDSFVMEGQVVGELMGQIGHMHDYCQDPVNRWKSLRHPVPFVFFHPHLPIYIDTRKEGTRCRYIRRSCRPNLKMKTILTVGLEYHFCFIAMENLEPGSEVTIGWVLDENIRKYLDRAHFGTRVEGSIKQEGLTEAEADYISLWVGKVLADFGGCACNDPQHCTLAQFDRSGGTSPSDSAIHLHNGRSKKSRHGVNNISPLITGYAANSRDCSEGMKGREEDDHDDSRSTSGSTHSKPRSRDMTPATRFLTDVGSAPGPELSDREKRKIAAAERTFEQLAQDNKIQRRKKRTSGGSNPNTPDLGNSVRSAKFTQRPQSYANLQSQKQLGHTTISVSHPNTPNVVFKPNYIDSAASQGLSQSPTSRNHQRLNMTDEAHEGASQYNTSQFAHASDSLRPRRPTYVDAMMQTEPDDTDAWLAPPLRGDLKRKPFVSLTRRLLQRCHEERVRLEHHKDIVVGERSRTDEPTSNVPLLVDDSAQSDTPMPSAMEVKQQDSQDIEMRDIGPDSAEGAVLNPSDSTVEKPRPPDALATTAELPTQEHNSSTKPPPPPWPTSPSTPAHHVPLPSNGYRCVDLRVQLPPPPLFTTNTTSTPSVSGTPTSTINSVAQSPISHGSHSYPPAFSLSVTQMVQPSPVKKKLSLGDYMSRKSNKAEPSTALDKGNQATSPTAPLGLLKPSTSFKEQSKAQTVEGSAIEEGPRTEEHSEPTVAMDTGA